MLKRGKNLPKPSPNRPNVRKRSHMKFPFLLGAVCVALLFTSCADQSLLTDEEYREIKGPAPHSPDPMQNIPETATTSNRPVGF